MNSKQYEKMMYDMYQAMLADNNIDKEDCVSVVLSADRTTYEIEMRDGSVKTIPSGFDYFED